MIDNLDLDFDPELETASAKVCVESKEAFIEFFDDGAYIDFYYVKSYTKAPSITGSITSCLISSYFLSKYF